MTETTPAAPCPNTETLLALAHGELPLPEVPTVRAHVRQCSRCTEEMSIMKRISTEIGGLAEAVEAPVGLRSRVLSSLRFRERRTRWNIFDVVRICAAVAAGVIALTVIAAQIPHSAMMGASRSGVASPSATSTVPVATGSFNVAQRGNPDAVARPESPQGSAAAVPSAPALARRQSQAGFPGGEGRGAPLTARHVPMVTTSQDYDDAFAPGRRNGDLYSQPYRPRVGIQVPTSGPDVTPDDIRRYTHGEAIEDPKRKVVHDLTLGVRVNRSLETIQDEITARVRKDGGYVENANLNSAANSERTAEMTLRVPVERFDAMTQWLSGLGEVKAKSATGEDVTGTWVDQRAELREFRAEEERLQKEYDKAKTAAAREMVHYQLLRLRTRIRASEERFALTTKLAALATIRLSLTEEPQARVRGSLLPDLDNTFRSALSAFMIAIRIPLGALIWLAVFSPLWVPCVLVYRWATRRALERDLATKPAA